MQEGIIIKGIGGFYYVRSYSGVFECKPRGIFRKGELVPTVGDLVEFSINDESNLIGVIEKIKPRKNLLERPAVSNIDQLIIVFAVKSPEPDYMLLDKLLIKAVEIGIEPVICMNKIDLCPSGFNGLKGYENSGFKILFVSASAGIGIDKLKETARKKVSILAGPSGVGKSTIINALNINVSVKTGDISSKIERGKHTTRHVELFETEDGGYIADTPGFSVLNISTIYSDKLKDYYPEFDNYIESCRFTGCTHISEPDCGVKEALQVEEIDRQRYERYIELHKILKKVERFKK